MSVEGEAVKIVANFVAPDMIRLGGRIFGCGVRRLAPFEWIGNCGPRRAGSNKVWKWDRHPPACSPGEYRIGRQRDGQDAGARARR